MASLSTNRDSWLEWWQHFSPPPSLPLSPLQYKPFNPIRFLVSDTNYGDLNSMWLRAGRTGEPPSLSLSLSLFIFLISPLCHFPPPALMTLSDRHYMFHFSTPPPSTTCLLSFCSFHMLIQSPASRRLSVPTGSCCAIS